MSNGTTTYPYWDTANRYLVAAPLRVDAGTSAGFTSKPLVFAQIFAHSGGYYRARCYGNAPSCPVALGGYYKDLAAAQAAIQTHCSQVHYILPPP